MSARRVSLSDDMMRIAEELEIGSACSRHCLTMTRCKSRKRARKYSMGTRKSSRTVTTHDDNGNFLIYRFDARSHFAPLAFCLCGYHIRYLLPEQNFLRGCVKWYVGIGCLDVGTYACINENKREFPRDLMYCRTKHSFLDRVRCSWVGRYR